MDNLGELRVIHEKIRGIAKTKIAIAKRIDKASRSSRQGDAYATDLRILHSAEVKLKTVEEIVGNALSDRPQTLLAWHYSCICLYSIRVIATTMDLSTRSVSRLTRQALDELSENNGAMTALRAWYDSTRSLIG
ncbi:MAG: hypothetical protein E7001_00455 [Coriobacteriaceae bacterium]|nr:hypothetical protein [Coriobacteriaceae bacterium]